MKKFKYYNRQLKLWFYVVAINRRETEGAGRFQETAFRRLQEKLGTLVTVQQNEFQLIDTRSWVPLPELKAKLSELLKEFTLPMGRLNLSDQNNLLWLERNLLTHKAEPDKIAKAIALVKQIKAGGAIVYANN